MWKIFVVPVSDFSSWTDTMYVLHQGGPSILILLDDMSVELPIDGVDSVLVPIEFLL